MMWVYAGLYGSVSLLSLWAFGGGETSLFWERTPIVSLVILLLGVLVAIYSKEKDRLLERNPSLKTVGFGGALLVSVPVCLLIYFAKDQPDVAPLLIKTPSLAYAAAFALIVAPAFELSYRGLLQPQWGLFGCAFLEALNVGFGTHRVLPFLAVFILTYAGGVLRSRFGFMTGLVFRVTWTFLILSTLYFI